jgi:predicted NAD/FAD-binding protein
MTQTSQRIAVVGAGISGLSAAWLLQTQHEVVLFESGSYFGGHANTVDVTLEGKTHPVDTGFLVLNDLTYPNLLALFKTLNVQTHASEMTFGVSIDTPDVEWAGTSIATLFAQKRNVFRPAFLGMLIDIARFNRHAQTYLEQTTRDPVSLGQLLQQHGYGQSMQDWYLLPMAAAIWSSTVRDILQFPAATFLRFCINHRLLQVSQRPQWRTVLGGSRAYVKAIVDQLADARLQTPVYSIKRFDDHVLVNGERFDAVVMACHAPTALKLLDSHPDETAALGGFRYQTNYATLHTDKKLLPRRKAVWSAWNYAMAGGDQADRPTSVSYLINLLQPLPFKTPVIVSLNSHVEPDPSHIIQTFEYEHPVMDHAAIAAQLALPGLQGKRRTWFCGAWCGYGFHEDGLKSAMAVALDFGIDAPWVKSLPVNIATSSSDGVNLEKELSHAD